MYKITEKIHPVDNYVPKDLIIPRVIILVCIEAHACNYCCFGKDDGCVCVCLLRVYVYSV